MGGRVKICGLTEEATIETALTAGADYGGVVLGPARRQVPWETARRWAERYPRRLVAVLRGAAPEVWERLGEVPWAGIQVYDAPRPDWVKWARSQGWLAICPSGPGQPPVADVWLLETPRPGTGERLDWWRVERPATRFWLAGGLTPENVAEAVRALAPDGVDVSSGVEIEGRKDRERVREFVRRAREAMG